VSSIRVSTVIKASPRQVWRSIEDIESHVRWMSDAEAIRITSRRSAGVGTTFECDTRVGPFTLLDRMEITEWRARRSMGVRHVGTVSGSGRFTLRPVGPGRTRFTWREHLSFPWWMGGPIGGVVGSEMLRLVWKRNLRNLKRLVEDG
jgi:uncharacterized protein YndB with AHSA1/START domain